MEKNLKGKYSQLIRKRVVKSNSSRFNKYEVEEQFELSDLVPGTIVEIYVGKKSPFDTSFSPYYWTYDLEIRIVASNARTLKRWDKYRDHCLKDLDK